MFGILYLFEAREKVEREKDEREKDERESTPKVFESCCREARGSGHES